jgi:hypothetical protein
MTHLGAREYEPAAGRVISVDPVMNLADPTQWNGYSYANANPVTGSDPDGLCLRLDDRSAPCVTAPNYAQRQAAFETRERETKKRIAKDHNFECRRMGECGPSKPIRAGNPVERKRPNSCPRGACSAPYRPHPTCERTFREVLSVMTLALDQGRWWRAGRG